MTINNLSAKNTGERMSYAMRCSHNNTANQTTVSSAVRYLKFERQQWYCVRYHNTQYYLGQQIIS